MVHCVFFSPVITEILPSSLHGKNCIGSALSLTNWRNSWRQQWCLPPESTHINRDKPPCETEWRARSGKGKAVLIMSWASYLRNMYGNTMIYIPVWPTSVGKITMQSEFPKLHGDRRQDALFRQVEQAGKEPSICNMWLVGRQLVDAHSICYLFLLCFPNMVIYKYCAALKILKCPRLPCAMLGLLGNWRNPTSGKQPARAKPLGLSLSCVSYGASAGFQTTLW